jgi:hypothetical protein
VRSVAISQTAYGLPVPSRSRNFAKDIHPFTLKRGHGLLNLDRLAGFDHLSVVRANRFGDIMGQNIEVGFTADLVPPNLMQALKLAVDQEVTQFEILDENDRRGAVDDILQPLLAGAQRILGLPSIAVLSRQVSICPLLFAVQPTDKQRRRHKINQVGDIY